jgi:hypothetical protein
MKADNWEGHKEVFKHSVLPIDESCIIEEDVKCHNHFHINIKLVKCGGLTRLANDSAKTVKNNGRMHDRIVSISAIAHLLPQLIMLIWMALYLRKT